MLNGPLKALCWLLIPFFVKMNMTIPKTCLFNCFFKSFSKVHLMLRYCRKISNCCTCELLSIIENGIQKDLCITWLPLKNLVLPQFVYFVLKLIANNFITFPGNRFKLRKFSRFFSWLYQETWGNLNSRKFC